MRVRHVQPARLRRQQERHRQPLRPQHLRRVEVGALACGGLEEGQDDQEGGVDAEVERVEVQQDGERQTEVEGHLGEDDGLRELKEMIVGAMYFFLHL